MAGVDPLTENPLVSSFYFADPTGQGMTLEQLKARRAIAAALASKSRDYPNTLGKGIYSLGESIGGAIGDYKLDTAEKAMRARDYEKLRASPPAAGPAMEPPPPIGAPGPAAAAPAPAGATAGLDPGVDLSRAQIVEALMGGAEGSRPAAGPAPVRMAALPSAGTMSDAGQPGATYGGPSPAGPGASMAERPDQAPPAPSAPPPTMAGQTPGGTPGPQPVAGGGVPPGPAGMAGPAPTPGGGGPLPPAVDASRAGLAQQIAGENQAFNPDAAPPGGPGGGIPPTMLAQVGGFGPGSTATGIPPETLPQQNRPGPQYGRDGRPIPPPEFKPPTEADLVRQFGPRGKPPEQWPAADKLNYQRARAESMDPWRSDEYKALKRAEMEDIVKGNQARYTTAHEDYRSRDTLRQQQENKYIEDLRQKNKDANDPEFQSKKELAESNKRIIIKTGEDPEKVHARMATEQENTRKAMRHQEDNQVVLQAIRDGIFTGTAAPAKQQLAKLNAWLTNSEFSRQKATNTETARARLLGGISEFVRELRPASNVETQLGAQASGADISLEEGTIKNIVNQSIQRNNEQISRYDSEAQRIYGGERQAKRFESPSLDWVPKTDVELLTRNAANPATLPRHIQQFNDIYGPGSAQTVLNRVKLRGGAL